jgi:hypothetical protein
MLCSSTFLQRQTNARPLEKICKHGYVARDGDGSKECTWSEAWKTLQSPYFPPAMSQKPVSICERSAYVQTTASTATHPRRVDEDLHQLVDAFRRLMHRMLLDQRCHGNISV